jgi:hypothetical protein
MSWHVLEGGVLAFDPDRAKKIAPGDRAKKTALGDRAKKKKEALDRANVLDWLVLALLSGPAATKQLEKKSPMSFLRWVLLAACLGGEPNLLRLLRGDVLKRLFAADRAKNAKFDGWENLLVSSGFTTTGGSWVSSIPT